MGYGNKGWRNTAIDENGNLKPDYMARLELILDEADRLGMVAILGIYYFGQDQFMKDEASIIAGVDNTINWLHKKGYKNILIEINNECDVNEYDHDILKPARVHELINRVKQNVKDGYVYPVGTSFKGNAIPTSNVVKASDFILIHGNGVSDPARITEMVNQTRAVDGFKPMPVVFNEDDHYKFTEKENNYVAAVKAYASWGFFDFRRKGESIEEGYQSVPVDWGINSGRKKAFFEKTREITGAY